MDEHINIIKSLLASGMTQAEIGAAIGRSQAWVSAVLGREFQDIKWQEGVKLRELHASRVSGVKLHAA